MIDSFYFFSERLKQNCPCNYNNHILFCELYHFYNCDKKIFVIKLFLRFYIKFSLIAKQPNIYMGKKFYESWLIQVI